MLRRMHGEPRPRAWVDIRVMQVMNAVVKRRPMDGAVGHVEVHRVEEHEHEHQCRAVDGRLGPARYRRNTLRLCPKREGEVGRPNGNAGSQGPKDVARRWPAKQKLVTSFHRPVRAVLELKSLTTTPIQNVVPCAIDDGSEHYVATEQQRNPAGGQMAQITSGHLQDFP